MKKILSLLTLVGLLIPQISSASDPYDLMIKGATYEFFKTSGYVNINICNVGGASTPNARLIPGIDRADAWPIKEIQEVGILKPNDCTIMRVNYGLQENTTYSLNLSIESAGRGVEVNTSNNNLTVELALGSKPKSTGNTAFPDIQSGTLEAIAADELFNRNVIGGYPDGEFKGLQTVNRAEVAKFILLANNISVEEVAVNQNLFSDIEPQAWYMPYIQKAYELDILAGYPDGTFRPADTINTAEFLKILVNTFGLERDLDHFYTDVEKHLWFETYAGAAYKYDLFPERSSLKLEPSKELTRKEVAIAIYKILESN